MALALADVISVVETGHTRPLGTPSVFQRPANTFTAVFIGSTSTNQCQSLWAII